ncbi:MAG: hypothetical protein ACKO7W_05230 [Elainella sp.]
MSELKLIAYHGWGYDGSVWQNWRDWFAALGYGFEAADRGYFGPASGPSWAGRPIVLVHSYGLHWAMQDWQQQGFPAIEALICFASFQNFHPEAERPRTRSQKIVQQMIDQFSLHPAQVLQSFWGKSAHPDPWPLAPAQTAQLNQALLHQDLQSLNQAHLDLTPLRAIPNLWVFQGGADRIVAPARGQALAEQLAAAYLELPEAGHTLPFTQAETCQAKLKALL